MFLRIQSANIVIFIVILCNYLAATAVEMKKTVLVLLTALVLSACGPKDRFIQVTGHAQGGVYTVKVNLKGVSVTPEEIRDSVDAILVRVDTTLSGYNKGSLLSRFNAGETIRPNGLFLECWILRRARSSMPGDSVSSRAKCPRTRLWRRSRLPAGWAF